MCPPPAGLTQLQSLVVTNSMEQLKDQFYQLADTLTQQLSGNQVFLANIVAEASYFVRFNHAAIRQAGKVQQQSIELTLINGARQASGSITLSTTAYTDQAQLRALLKELRNVLENVPDDPYCNYNREPHDTLAHGLNQLSSSAQIVAEIRDHCRDQDMVGTYAAGGCARGFANSLGQRNWFDSYSFNFDWSVFLHSDRAVKCGYVGTTWDSALFAGKCANASNTAAILARPAVTPNPAPIVST